MPDQRFRATLERLAGWGELDIVEREVDPCFELGAVISLRRDGRAADGCRQLRISKIAVLDKLWKILARRRG